MSDSEPEVERNKSVPSLILSRTRNANGLSPERTRALTRGVAVTNASEVRLCVFSDIGPTLLHGFWFGRSRGPSTLWRHWRCDAVQFSELASSQHRGRLHECYKLVILSNRDRDMLEAAKPHIGISFDAMISVQEAGYLKPHWKTYAKAAELPDVDRSSIVFVANHAFDCVGAKSYGMRTAFNDRRKRPFGDWLEQPDLIVKHMAELAAFLV